MAAVAGIHNAASLQPAGNTVLDAVADKMPSVRALSGYALSAFGLAQTALSGTTPNKARQLSNAASASCPNAQLSCHNTTVQTNLCCFNAPGGSLLQTQFWDYSPATGPSDSWTIHGLWPDHCDGTYDANCDDRRAYTNITQILQAAGATDTLSYMQTYWKDYQGNDESFWEHEWGKHGTCISTLDPDCYTDYQPTEEVPDFFDRVVSLFKTLPSYEWLSAAGITPSTTATYTRAQISDALSQKHGGSVYLGCSSGNLNEIWYYYNVRGSVQSGTFEPANNDGSSSSCPATGIKYPPKGSSSSPTSTRTSAAPSPTATGPAFSGSGYLNVIASGSKKGCLISGGTWYTSGTCATYHATSSGDGFTLTSSKGNCGVASGKFTCGSGVSASTFSSDGNSLIYNDSGDFSADSTASGSTQVAVYSGSDHNVALEIQWQSV